MFRKTGDAIQPVQVLTSNLMVEEESDPDLIDTVIVCDGEDDSITEESQHE